jgi:hypothetical protein
MKVGALLHEAGKRRILTQTEDKVLHVRSATFISFIVIEVFIDVAILQYCNWDICQTLYICKTILRGEMKHYIVFVKRENDDAEPIQDVYEVSEVLYEIIFDVLTGVIADHPMPKKGEENGSNKSEGPTPD